MFFQGKDQQPCKQDQPDSPKALSISLLFWSSLTYINYALTIHVTALVLAGSYSASFSTWTCKYFWNKISRSSSKLKFLSKYLQTESRRISCVHFIRSSIVTVLGQLMLELHLNFFYWYFERSLNRIKTKFDRVIKKKIIGFGKAGHL